MRGIEIIMDGKRIHTGNDLDLVQEVKTIGKPEIQTYTVSVPGRNGLINLTSALTGYPTYSNRALSFQYFGSGSRKHLLELDSLFSKFHGHTVKIVDDDSPEYYYEGEVAVNTEINGTYITIVLNVDAQPFKYGRKPAVYARKVSERTIIHLTNNGVPTVPKMTLTERLTVSNGETTLTLDPGEYLADVMVLPTGVTTFEVTGNGVITIEYREGVI